MNLTINEINRLQELVQDRLSESRNELEKAELIELDNKLADELGKKQ